MRKQFKIHGSKENVEMAKKALAVYDSIKFTENDANKFVIIDPSSGKWSIVAMRDDIPKIADEKFPYDIPFFTFKIGEITTDSIVSILVDCD